MLINTTGLQLAVLQVAVFVPMALQVSTLPYLPDLGEAHQAELIAGSAQIASRQSLPPWPWRCLQLPLALRLRGCWCCCQTARLGMRCAFPGCTRAWGPL